MSDYVCLLITVLYESQQTLMTCALKFKKWQLDPEVYIYPLEDEHRQLLHAMLPDHVRNLGPIVAVEEVFEIHVVPGE